MPNLGHTALIPDASAAWPLRAPLAGAVDSSAKLAQPSDWSASFATIRALESFPISFDRAHLTLDAATQGLGVTLQSTTIAAAHLAEKKLRLVFDPDQCVSKEVHFAAYPATHAKRPPVQAFLAGLDIETAQSKQHTH